MKKQKLKFQFRNKAGSLSTFNNQSPREIRHTSLPPMSFEKDQQVKNSQKGGFLETSKHSVSKRTNDDTVGRQYETIDRIGEGNSPFMKNKDSLLTNMTGENSPTF